MKTFPSAKIFGMSQSFNANEVSLLVAKNNKFKTMQNLSKYCSKSSLVYISENLPNLRCIHTNPNDLFEDAKRCYKWEIVKYSVKFREMSRIELIILAMGE
jgi:hypothetical protein